MPCRKKVSPPLCFPSPGAQQLLWLVRDSGLVSLRGGLGKGPCRCWGGPGPAGGMERRQHGAGWSTFGGFGAPDVTPPLALPTKLGGFDLCQTWCHQSSLFPVDLHPHSPTLHRPARPIACGQTLGPDRARPRNRSSLEGGCSGSPSSAPWGAQPHRQHPAHSQGWVLYGCSVLGRHLGANEAGGSRGDISPLPHSRDAPGQRPAQV